jgi:hypothetical protein
MMDLRQLKTRRWKAGTILTLCVITGIASAQGGDTAKQEPLPKELAAVIPPGTNPDFHATVNEIKQLLTEQKNARALSLAEALPKRKIRAKWDDSKVPVAQRASFIKARDKAVGKWVTVLRDISVEWVKDKANVAFSFAPKLAPLPNKKGLQGLALVGTDRGYDAVIGLQRGNPAGTTSDREVHNEVVYTLGAYFGLAPTKYFGSAMGRTDQRATVLLDISSRDSYLARETLNLSQEIREAAEKNFKLAVGSARLTTDTKSIDLGTVFEGDVVSAPIQLNNVGAGTLRWIAYGDCACVTSEGPTEVQGQSSVLIRAVYDTTDQIGEIRHALVVLNNDPDKAELIVPIRVKVVPRVRLVLPNGDARTIVLKPNQTKFEAILVLAETWKGSVLASGLVGGRGTVNIEKWEGQVEDTLGESGKVGALVKRRGYKATFDLSGDPVPGRSSLGFYVITGDARRPRISLPLYVQTGLVAMPESVYFGSTMAAAAEAQVYLTRPGFDLKVKSVKCEDKQITVKVEQTPVKGELRLRIRYKGNAKQILRSEIVVTTNDPQQKTVRIPVRAGG